MSSAPPTVEASVIIPCHNSTRTLGLQLDALANQVGAPPFEVVIADNGSSDGLEGFLDAWRDRLTLRYVDAGRLKGAAYARNVGMSIAAADRWLFCDSDDVVARDWVAQGSAALDEVEVFSGPGLKVADEQLDADFREAWRVLDAGLPPGQPLQPGLMVPWPILLGGNSGLRRKAAQDVGGYDAGVGHAIEDNDLALRIQLSGRTIAAAPGARILYRERGGAFAIFRRSREAGEWHMALCKRYGLWDRSPHIRGGWWWLELPRCVLSGVRMVVVPRSLSSILRHPGARLGVTCPPIRSWTGSD